VTVNVDLSTIELDVDRWEYVINESTYVRLVVVDESPKVNEQIIPLDGIIIDLVENAGREDEIRTTQSNIIGLTQGVCSLTSIYPDLQGMRIDKNNYKNCTLTIVYEE